MSQRCMAVNLTVSEIQRQKWTGKSHYPPLARIRVNENFLGKPFLDGSRPWLLPPLVLEKNLQG